MSHPLRLCPSCNSAERVSSNEKIWPENWSCHKCGNSIPTEDGIQLFAPSLADSVTGMDPKSFAFLAEVELNNFWFVPRNRLLSGLICRHFPDSQSFLEIGCGSATVLSAIAKAKPWQRLAGAELHPTALRIARNRLENGIELVQMDARFIPVETGFDVIGAFDVLEHIEEDTRVLEAMHRAIRPGGGLVLAVPQHPWLWSPADEMAYHVRRYRRGELEKKVQLAGFNIVFSGSYTSLLLPMMAVSRLLARIFKDKGSSADSTERQSAGAEFEVPAALNSLLKKILDLEVSMTFAGIHFPAGGSRVVVAQKI